MEIAQEFVERYPGTFRLYVQKDRGHARLNMAFARSTGDILGYLNTDDTSVSRLPTSGSARDRPCPGAPRRVRPLLVHRGGLALRRQGAPGRVQRPFRPARRVEARPQHHPPAGHVLAPKGLRDVRGIREKHNHGLDYLQWCRFSGRFWFHKVDELWSTYRMHPVSVTANKTEQEWLAIMIQYSRMHWGPWWRPLRWRCSLSHRLHNGALHEEARQCARRAEQAIRGGRYGEALGEGMRMAVCSPRMAYYALSRLLPAWGLGVGLQRALWSAREDGFAGKYPDNWIGPMYRSEVQVAADARRLIMVLEHHPQGHHRRVSPALSLDGKVVERQRVSAPGQVSFAVDLIQYRGRACALEVRTPEFFVPRFVSGDPDDRTLSLLLVDQRVE